MTMAAPAGQRDAVVDGVDVDRVAAAVRGCPAVADLLGGPPTGAATYLPGRRIDGIAVTAGTVLVQVRSRWVASAELAVQVRAAVAVVAPRHRVDVVVADIEDPPAAPPPTATPATPSPTATRAASTPAQDRPAKTAAARPRRPRSNR
jgi:hypothetical protein